MKGGGAIRSDVCRLKNGNPRSKESSGRELASLIFILFRFYILSLEVSIFSPITTFKFPFF